MVTPGSTNDGERASRDLWERTLAQISTVFGQLSYLASLREEHSACYRHYGLAQMYGEEAADRALRASHEEAFAEWLNFPLEKQRSELERYLDDLTESREDVLRSWAAITPYRNLVPAGAGDAERRLFLADIEIILELLRNELASSS